MNLIVAVDKRWGIGKDGGLLTHLPKDLGRFQRLTTGNIVVMGRKTVESLPGNKLLPNRETWILTRNEDYKREGALVFHSIEEIEKYITKESIDSNRVFVAGGGVVYNAFSPIVETAYITKLDRDFEADVYMNNLDDSPYLYLEHVGETYENKGLDYCFCTYKKVK